MKVLVILLVPDSNITQKNNLEVKYCKLMAFLGVAYIFVK